MSTRNQKSGHESTETLPCIKRLPTNVLLTNGAQSRVQETQRYRWRSKNCDRYDRYLRELMLRLRGEVAESVFRTRKGTRPD